MLGPRVFEVYDFYAEPETFYASSVDTKSAVPSVAKKSGFEKSAGKLLLIPVERMCMCM